MYAAGVQQIIHKIILDALRQDDASHVSIDHICHQIKKLRDADVRVFPTRGDVNVLRAYIIPELRRLVRLRLLDWDEAEDHVSLTGAGQVTGIALTWPPIFARRIEIALSDQET